MQQRVVFVSYGPRSNQCLKNRRLPPPVPPPPGRRQQHAPNIPQQMLFCSAAEASEGRSLLLRRPGEGTEGGGGGPRRSDKITWCNYHNIKIKSEVLSTAVLWVERRLIRLYSLVDIFMVIMLYLVRTGGCKETPSTDQHRPQSSSHDKQLTAMYG